MTRKEICKEFKKLLKIKTKKSRQTAIVLLRVLSNMDGEYGKDVYRKLYGKCKNIKEVLECYIRLRKEYYDFRKTLDIDW